MLWCSGALATLRAVCGPQVRTVPRIAKISDQRWPSTLHPRLSARIIKEPRCHCHSTASPRSHSPCSSCKSSSPAFAQAQELEATPPNPPEHLDSEPHNVSDTRFAALEQRTDSHSAAASPAQGNRGAPISSGSLAQLNDCCLGIPGTVEVDLSPYPYPRDHRCPAFATSPTAGATASLATIPTILVFSLREAKYPDPLSRYRARAFRHYHALSKFPLDIPEVASAPGCSWKSGSALSGFHFYFGKHRPGYLSQPVCFEKRRAALTISCFDDSLCVVRRWFCP